MKRLFLLFVAAGSLWAQTTLATFSRTEYFGVGWPNQIIEFAYAGGQPVLGTTRMMLSVNGGAQAEVPYSWSAADPTKPQCPCIVVESNLGANAANVWTLQSGIAPTQVPTNPATLATVGNNYELTNGLTGVRVITAAANASPFNKAPIQGVKLPSGTWTGVGGSPNLLYTESTPGAVGAFLGTAMSIATGYSCSTVTNGQMKVQVACTYVLNQPRYYYGANTISPATSSGHYTAILTLYADAKSIEVDEDSGAQFRYQIPIIAQVTPDTMRWKGHGPTLDTRCGYDTPFAVTGATNASPIVITGSGTLPNNGQTVTISGVGGNTAANVTNAYAKTNGYASGSFGLYSDSGLSVPIAGNGVYTSSTGTVYGAYQGWTEAVPAYDAFSPVTYTSDVSPSYQCSAGSTYATTLTNYEPACDTCGRYFELYNSSGGSSSPVVAAFKGDFSLDQNSALGSEPGPFSTNANFITSTTSAGIERDNLLRSPANAVVTGVNGGVVHTNWGIFVGTNADLLAANQFQPIQGEMNAKTGINLTRVGTYQLTYSNPGGGWTWAYMPAAGANQLIAWVQDGTSVCGSSACYYNLLYSSESSTWGRAMLDMWRTNSTGSVASALATATTEAANISTVMASGDNHWDQNLGYYQLGLQTSPETAVVNAILMNANTTTAQQNSAKAFLALVGCLFWDNDWFPIDNNTQDSQGLANQLEQYYQYRTQSAGAAPTQPFLATKLSAAAVYPPNDLNAYFSSTGAVEGSTHYQSAFTEPLEVNYYALTQAGSLNFSSALWPSYANWELSIQTPPEPRFGNVRKGYSNGDGNTEADVRTGMLATALEASNLPLAENLMWAYNASNSASWKTEDSQFISTLVTIDPTIPAVTPALGSINIPGYHTAERVGFGTVHETADWFINGGFYAVGGHRHYDDGQVSIYAHNAPLAIDWNPNLYYPEVPGRLQHNSVTFDSEITGSGLTWSQDNLPLTAASRRFTAPTNTEFLNFSDSTSSTATFTFFAATWQRTVRTIAPNAEYPIIVVEDTFSGSPGGMTVTWNMMDNGTVSTPAGNITPTTRFSAGCQSPAGALPSNGAVNSLSTGLQHFVFTGATWAAHPTGGINWDLYTSNPSGSAQFLVGNWGHGCQSTREASEYEAANSVGSFAEVQDILRVHDTGVSPMTTIILPYRKTETPTRTVTAISSGTSTCPIGSTASTQVVQGSETTCWNGSLISYTNGTTKMLGTLDTSSQTGFSMTLGGGAQELVQTSSTAIRWTISGVGSTTRSITLPSGTWYPTPSGVGSPGQSFSYSSYVGGVQSAPVTVTFSHTPPATVYLRSSAPASQSIVGATNATPIVLTTAQAHGFPATCNNTSNICYCSVEAVPTGVGSSPANGIRECGYVDATHISLYQGPLDVSPGTAVAGTGAWWYGMGYYPNTQLAGQWVSLLTPYTLPSGPVGWLDGTNGDLMRRVSVGPLNGLTSVVVSGGSAGSCASVPCVVTATTSYDPTSSALLFPVAAGQQFSIHGTATGLDICGTGGGAHSPYTMASASSTGWVSAPFTCAGLATGDYTNGNLHCGPAATPNDTIGGTQSCTRVSQMAYTGNTWWDGMLANTNYVIGLSSPSYKSVWDGGTQWPGGYSAFASAATQFLVDPTSALHLEQSIYAINYDFRTYGVTYPTNDQAGYAGADFDFLASLDIGAEGFIYSIVQPLMAASEAASFLDRKYNDVDYAGHVCSTANTDMGKRANHTWILSSANAQAGTNDGTHVTLAASDSQPDNYYVNTIIELHNNGQNFDCCYTFGLITGYVAATKVATVAGGWFGQYGATSPALDNIVSGTYTSGLTCTGTTGQYAAMGLGNAQFYVALTGTNTIAGGSSLVVYMPGSGFTSGSYSAAYGGSASTASCTGTPTVSIVAGTSYVIYDTVTRSGNVYTFTKTSSLTGSINSGDAIAGFNAWGSELQLNQYTSYVSTVGPGSSACGTLTASQLCVINNSNPSASSTPSIARREIQWTSGDCGHMKGHRHLAAGTFGSASIDYPSFTVLYASPKYGYSNGYIKENFANGGGTEVSAFSAVDFALSPFDPRAVRDLARTQGFSWDYLMRPFIDYSTGFTWDGARYALDTDNTSTALHAFTFRNSTSGTSFPSTYGTWLKNSVLYKMFSTLPDLQQGGPSTMGWGGSGSVMITNPAGGETSTVFGLGFVFNANTFFEPHANLTNYWRNFLENVSKPGAYPSNSLWNGNMLYTEQGYSYIAFLMNDPRTGKAGCTSGDTTCDYTTLPPQFNFNVSSPALCQSLTGWPCNEYRGDFVVSRTGWTHLTDSLLWIDYQTFNSDAYQSIGTAGKLSFYKAGCLLCSDSGNPGNGLWNEDPTILSDTVRFGPVSGPQFLDGTGNFYPTPSTAWGASTAGSLGVQFGDPTGRYIYSCYNGVNEYNSAASSTYPAGMNLVPSYVNRCIVHFKESAKDEFIVQLDDIAISQAGCNGTGPLCSSQINFHQHYWQAGETEYGTGLLGGKTFCVNSSYAQVDCATLNSNRLIESIENAGNSPATNNGLMSHFDSPGTITLNWDCPGSYTIGNQPQCSPGNTYPGGAGYTNRITVAGGASTSATVSGMTTIVEHKVMQNRTDTALSTITLNPDPNWTGVQMCGGISCAVFVGGIGGTLHSVMAGFTTTHPGTAQYVIGGFAPGSYTITRNSVGVTGSPFTVSAGDGSVYFDSLSGAIAVNGTVSNCSIVTTSLPGGTVGVAYSQTIATANCTAPVTWSISAGTICSGLTLGASTGVVSGTPSAAQTCSFTAQVVDAGSHAATQAFSITIASAPMGGATLFKGAPVFRGAPIIH